MKKRNLFVCLALILALLFSIPAGATGVAASAPGEAVAGFIQDDEVFVYFDMQGEDVDSLQVGLKQGDKMPDSKSFVSLVPFAESDLPVHYYILLDRSGTMPQYSDEVEEFVEELLANTNVDACATLASFGDAYEREIYAAVDKDAVLKKLEAIEYDEMITNLYKGVDDALEDIGKFQQRNRGELVQLILVTDGVPDGTYEEPTFEQVKLRLERSPEVIFHTYQVGNAEEDPLEMGNGLHLGGSPKEDAQAIIDYAEEKHVAVFEPSTVPAEGRHAMQFIFKQSGAMLPSGSLEYMPVLGHAGAPDMTVTSEPESTPESDPESSTASDPECSSESEPESGTESTPESIPEGSMPESSEETSLPEGSDESNPEGTDDTESSEVPGDEDDKKGSFDLIAFLSGIDDTTWLIIDIVTVVMVLLIVALVVLLIVRACRKKRRNAAPVPVAMAGTTMGAMGVPVAYALQLEVLSGRCKRVRKSLVVTDELYIGRDMNGGIVWDEPDMAEKNTRLFVQDGELYIEDLDSPQGTALGGMRIFAPNRLRSGEIISIGMVQFKLHF